MKRISLSSIIKIMQNRCSFNFISKNILDWKKNRVSSLFYGKFSIQFFTLQYYNKKNSYIEIQLFQQNEKLLIFLLKWNKRKYHHFPITVDIYWAINMWILIFHWVDRVYRFWVLVKKIQRRDKRFLRRSKTTLLSKDTEIVEIPW